jgi:hypothetical protein
MISLQQNVLMVKNETLLKHLFVFVEFPEIVFFNRNVFLIPAVASALPHVIATTPSVSSLLLEIPVMNPWIHPPHTKDVSLQTPTVLESSVPSLISKFFLLRQNLATNPPSLPLLPNLAAIAQLSTNANEQFLKQLK